MSLSDWVVFEMELILSWRLTVVCIFPFFFVLNVGCFVDNKFDDEDDEADDDDVLIHFKFLVEQHDSVGC